MQSEAVETDIGDKAYDSAELREDLHERGTKSIIPNRCNRKQPFRFNKRIYKLRWRIESAFNRLKDFRRIHATTGWHGCRDANTGAG